MLYRQIVEQDAPLLNRIGNIHIIQLYSYQLAAGIWLQPKCFTPMQGQRISAGRISMMAPAVVQGTAALYLDI